MNFNFKTSKLTKQTDCPLSLISERIQHHYGEDQLTDRAQNEEVLHIIKEESNILHTIKQRKANWIGHLCRNCLLKTRYLRKDKTKEKTEKKT
jgi:hypothetical protein